MTWVQQYQGLIVLLVGTALGLFGLIFRTQVMALVADKASASAVAAMDARMGQQEARMATMEAAIKHLPTAEQMHALSLAISDMRGEVRAVGTKVGGVEAMLSSLTRRVELIDEHLKRVG